MTYCMIVQADSSNYDYAVPELSSAPLLTKRRLADSLSERVTELVSDHVDKLDLETRRSTPASLRSKHSTRVRA